MQSLSLMPSCGSVSGRAASSRAASPAASILHGQGHGACPSAPCTASAVACEGPGARARPSDCERRGREASPPHEGRYGRSTGIMHAMLVTSTGSPTLSATTTRDPARPSSRHAGARPCSLAIFRSKRTLINATTPRHAQPGACSRECCSRETCISDSLDLKICRAESCIHRHVSNDFKRHQKRGLDADINLWGRAWRRILRRWRSTTCTAVALPTL